MMTLRARALGMNRTIFRNASGLPDPEQVTTARDLAVLARHLITISRVLRLFQHAELRVPRPHDLQS